MPAPPAPLMDELKLNDLRLRVNSIRGGTGGCGGDIPAGTLMFSGAKECRRRIGTGMGRAAICGGGPFLAPYFQLVFPVLFLTELAWTREADFI